MIDLNLQRTLLRAAPYRDFTGNVRPGKIHILKDDTGVNGERRTCCGKTLENCPGKIFSGTFSEADCKVCRNSIESADRYEEINARWAEQAAQHQAQRLEESQRWWAAYNQYLQSPTWAEKRRMVLRRANNICEGCGVRTATIVHHRSYPQSVTPGSEAWIRRSPK